MGLFDTISSFIDSLLIILGSWGAIVGCGFILVESIIPILPISVFITLNFMTFGPLIGFIISWVFTCLGCMLSYYIFRKGVSDKYFNKLKSSPKLGKFINAMEKANFAYIVTLIAIPFTPQFLINIAAGICRVNSKKFFYALLLGKISLVYFWGYVGTSLIESLKNPLVLIRVGFICIVMYVVSKFISKKLKID